MDMVYSLLATDGYKFSMAEAGWPLRTETFYYSHRRGGPHFLPFDVEEMVRLLLPYPGVYDGTDAKYLAANGYGMGGAYWKAMGMTNAVKVHALPKGSWFFDREPAFIVTGPSALVSWLEPLVLQLNYRIQVASIAKLAPDLLAPAVEVVTCERQREIVLETLDAAGVEAPRIRVDGDAYFDHVFNRIRGLIDIVGDPDRIFEVGMRGATCMEQHVIALMAAKEAGLRATSNVHAAASLHLKPVGTMGHEHVQRYGSDEAAFRAMRERHPGPSSFLLDTFSTLKSGLPTAFKLIAEDPSRGDSVRFDSGDKEEQFLAAIELANKMGIEPRFILEDGFNAEMTCRFEELREIQQIDSDAVSYGYGGYIVSDPASFLSRDRVSAVWKITQSGHTPTMKHGDEPGGGKESIPGRPILYRVPEGPSRGFGFVHQLDEEMFPGLKPPSEVMLTTEEAMAQANREDATRLPYFMSAKTAELVADLRQARNSIRNRR